jgi:hypothetical protein
VSIAKVTDEQGLATFPDLDQGLYTITVVGPSYNEELPFNPTDYVRQQSGNTYYLEIVLPDSFRQPITVALYDKNDR